MLVFLGVGVFGDGMVGFVCYDLIEFVCEFVRDLGCFVFGICFGM